MALKKKDDTRPKIVTIEVAVSEIPNLNQIATTVSKFGTVQYVAYSERGLLY